jgi:hypothetical protein
MPMHSGHSSCRYIDVDERFATVEQWMEHVRGLPARRPHDLWIRVTVDPVATVLRDDEYAFVPPWHLFVLKVFRYGIPGEWSHLAIVREAPGVNKQTVIESTELVASRKIVFTR